MYALKDDDGNCPRCLAPFSLLADATMPDGYPAFVICFGCRDVTHVDGEDGQTVVYRRGRRKKFPRVKKDPKAELPAKTARLIAHQAAKRAAEKDKRRRQP